MAKRKRGEVQRSLRRGSAVRWLAPGRRVQIDAPCLCCGEPISVSLQDEDVIVVEPEEAVGYTASQVGGDAASRPFR